MSRFAIVSSTLDGRVGKIVFKSLHLVEKIITGIQYQNVSNGISEQNFKTTITVVDQNTVAIYLDFQYFEAERIFDAVANAEHRVHRVSYSPE